MNNRIRSLNSIKETQGKSIMYVMSRDQRILDNHALIEAQSYALERKLPLVVVFNLFTELSIRCLQQYMFMITGLQQLEKELENLDIPFYIRIGTLSDNIEYLTKELQPAALFFDFSPLRNSVSEKDMISKKLEIPCFVVDTHNIVPVWEASDKEEWAAYTFRPKVKKLLPEYLHVSQTVQKHPYVIKIPPHNWNDLMSHIKAKQLSNYEIPFHSGEKEALNMLTTFIQHKLEGYKEKRNDPSEDYQSNLSPYLHFGQISSLTIALAVEAHVHQNLDNQSIKDSADAFLEELIVRKELTDNFCFYNTNYDNFLGLKDWAKLSLEKHSIDRREFLYDLEELEFAKTYDEAWNAAQKQLIHTGKMHGYMRMYWAKKILEWTPNAKTAIEYAVYLNDKYHLDGYDPNGYVGILWSIGGIHDRPWFERPIFGQIRYMNYNGLKKKFDIQKYIDIWR
jgi:deoxyribodipyrimidine photo-lyase